MIILGLVEFYNRFRLFFLAFPYTSYMKSVTIIGGGISGLTAGIIALKRGYNVTIVEKNAVPGGECMGWTRKGYYIDNCVHFMVIGPDGSPLRKLWEEIGALERDTSLYFPSFFYQVNVGGRYIALKSSLEETKQELFAIAPEDEEELSLFFKAVEDSKCILPPTSKPPYKMNLCELMALGKEFSKVSWVLKRYGKMPMHTFVSLFKNAAIKKVLGAYFAEPFTAMQLIGAYSFFVHRNAAVIGGGSKAISERIAERFKSLGGTLLLGREAKSLLVEKKKATALLLSTREKLASDFFIAACDLHHFFSEIIAPSYAPRSLRKEYEHPERNPIMTSFHIAFGITGNEDVPLPSGTTIFDVSPLKIGDNSYSSMGLRLYDEDPSLYPKGKRVLQTSFIGGRDFYAFFKGLQKDKRAYLAYKDQIADAVRARIEPAYPALAGRLILLDTFSPVTYERYCNAYEGSYMAFFPIDGLRSHKNVLPGLKNVFLASQWLNSNGGLPYALVNGKFAADFLK